MERKGGRKGRKEGRNRSTRFSLLPREKGEKEGEEKVSRGKSKILAGDSTIATRRERRRSGVGGDPARNGNSGSTRLDSTRLGRKEGERAE